MRLAGVLHLEPAAAGHSLHRLPGWTAPQVVDPALMLIRGMPSGCRVEMVTDATADRARGAAHDHPARRQQRGRRVRPRGRRRARRRPGHPRRHHAEDRHGHGRDGASCRAGPTTVRFEGLPAGGEARRGVAPQRGGGRPPRGAGRRQGRPRRRTVASVAGSTTAARSRTASRPPGPPGSGRWWPLASPASTCRTSASAGQCQLDGFTARTIRDLPADLISCKLGINIVNGDTMRERTFVPGGAQPHRHHPRGAPGRTARDHHADLLPAARGGAGPVRLRRREVHRGRAAGGAGGRRARPRAHPPARTPRSSPPGGPPATTTSTSSAASTSPGPTTPVTSPTTSTRTRRSTSAWGSGSTSWPSAPAARSPADAWLGSVSWLDERGRNGGVDEVPLPGRAGSAVAVRQALHRPRPGGGAGPHRRRGGRVPQRAPRAGRPLPGLRRLARGARRRAGGVVPRPRPPRARGRTGRTARASTSAAG